AVVVDDEELGAVGVGTGVGHGQCAGRVGLGAVELIGERVAGATAAGSGRVTALEDEDALGGQAVAVGVVEVLLPGQGQEAVDGAGCALGVEGHGQIAGTRGDGGLDLTGRLRGLGRNLDVLGRRLRTGGVGAG